MLNFDAPFNYFDQPFSHHIANDVMSPTDLGRLNTYLPQREIYERCIKVGAEHRKQYHMWRCEPVLESQPTPVASKLSDPWAELIDDTLRPEFRSWLSTPAGRDLTGLPMTVGLYQFEDGDYTTTDTGKLEKALSVAFYLNEHWESGYGGKLQMFTQKAGEAPPVKEVVPVGGRCVAVTPADNTWHRIERVDTGGRAIRYLMMVEIWRG